MSFASHDHPALIAAARHRLPLPGAPADAPAVIRPDELEGVRIAARTDRISGLLAGALRVGEVVVDGDDDGMAQSSVDDDWHDTLHASVLLEALLVRLAERLDGAGVRWRLTKGAAVAHLDEPDPALRGFADVDVVVHADDWDRALDAVPVERTGRTRALAFAHRYGKGATAMVDGMEIDVHLRFAVGRFATRARMADCFETADTVHLAGRAIPTLSAEFRLLHACHHAVLGGSAELRAFRDVAQLALASPATVTATWEVAREWGVEAVMASAIVEGWRRLRLPPDHPVVQKAATVTIGAEDRRVLELFAREAPFRQQVLTSWAALPHHERPRFAWSAWRMSQEHRS